MSSKNAKNSQDESDKPTYLTTEDVSELLGIPVRTLEDQRYRGVGPKYQKFGRAVRYKLEDILSYTNSEDEE
jgi:hypothetical protein